MRASRRTAPVASERNRLAIDRDLDDRAARTHESHGVEQARGRRRGDEDGVEAAATGEVRDDVVGLAVADVDGVLDADRPHELEVVVLDVGDDEKFGSGLLDDARDEGADRARAEHRDAIGDADVAA